MPNRSMQLLLVCALASTALLGPTALHPLFPADVAWADDDDDDDDDDDGGGRDDDDDDDDDDRPRSSRAGSGDGFLRDLFTPTRRVQRQQPRRPAPPP
ncbi:hypothetical protein, partial [Cereibacter changlensis]|uniref:hypothetical protein n=1 Tax=Cereibacter changlensis TaxID=402884 RepID=UPI001B802D2D